MDLCLITIGAHKFAAAEIDLLHVLMEDDDGKAGGVEGGPAAGVGKVLCGGSDSKGDRSGASGHGGGGVCCSGRGAGTCWWRGRVMVRGEINGWR